MPAKLGSIEETETPSTGFCSSLSRNMRVHSAESKVGQVLKISALSFAGLVIFSFFAIGDQIFGDRVELQEHTTFWMALIISWGAYIYFPKISIASNKRL